MMDFMMPMVSTWTINERGISASGEEDSRNASTFLQQNPSLMQALARRMERAMEASNAPTVSISQATETLVTAAAAETEQSQREVQLAPVATQAPLLAPTPAQPLRFESALQKYLQACATRKMHNARTSQDKERLLRSFCDFVYDEWPQLGTDPWVHQLDCTHVTAFLDDQAERPAKTRGSAKRAEKTPAPETMAATGTVEAGTLLKKVGDIRHFFKYMRRWKATIEDVVGDLEEDAAIWRQQARERDFHYRPFSSTEMAAIFSPAEFLIHSRDPDYFWCPLLGAHLGVRLGEVVMAEVDDIGQAPSGVWYLDVLHAKNSNSKRLLPITQPLIDLGFLDYVEHVRALGGTKLFPHRNWSNKTALRQPSKNQSRRFGSLMDKVGMKNADEVFHSFRHTIISAMADANVHLSIAKQIAGHEAQEFAIRTHRISVAEARSVHSTYIHMTDVRLGVDCPLTKLKSELERSVHLPLDYSRLSLAAKVVSKHLRHVGGEFRAGWPPQRLDYSQKMVASIAAHKPKPTQNRVAAKVVDINAMRRRMDA
ncbi:MAG: site-specific integrase [Pseudomonadota bacterium]